MYMILSVINSIGGNINELITRNEYNNNNLMTLPLPNLIKKLQLLLIIINKEMKNLFI